MFKKGGTKAGRRRQRTIRHNEADLGSLSIGFLQLFFEVCHIQVLVTESGVLLDVSRFLVSFAMQYIYTYLFALQRRMPSMMEAWLSASEKTASCSPKMVSNRPPLASQQLMTTAVSSKWAGSEHCKVPCVEDRVITFVEFSDLLLEVLVNALGAFKRGQKESFVTKSY